MNDFPYKQIEKKLGVTFNNKDLLLRAFTNGALLAYIGDAVIECVVREYLVSHHPDHQPLFGICCDQLLSNEMFSQIMFDFDIVQYIGDFKKDNLSRAATKRLGTVFEAIVAIIFQEQGMPRIKEFLFQCLLIKASELIQKAWEVPTLRLAVICQRYFGRTPSYRQVKFGGKNKKYRCRVRLTVKGKFSVTGRGRNRDEAKKNAAENALQFFVKFSEIQAKMGFSLEK